MKATAIVNGFKEQRRFFLVKSRAKNPATDGLDNAVYQKIMKQIKWYYRVYTCPTAGNIDDPSFNLLISAADGALVLAWVLVEHRP